MAVGHVLATVSNAGQIMQTADQTKRLCRPRESRPGFTLLAPGVGHKPARPVL
ncbi:MAG: hypothetical protein JW888_12640 [Pirellulales bacterium]|nr:hypothetical protein [Pirellulales bacterium]